MAGHSKWANIKHKKAAADAKRGKVWTRLIKEIQVAARMGGGEIDSNPRLRLAVDKAYDANMPKDNINRAIQRGVGGVDGANYEEIRYEGYGIGGAAVIVDTMTDNRTRTVAEVRHAFSKFGGNMGTDGSVSFMFDHVGQFLFAPGTPEDKLMDAALEAGADDVVTNEDGSIEVICPPNDFQKVKDALEGAGFKAEMAEVTMKPQTEVEFTGDDAVKMQKLLDALENLGAPAATVSGSGLSGIYMKLLVVGSGGREHALAWKLAQAPRVQLVYVAPGNGGTAQDERLANVDITDIHELADFAEREQIALTVVGPEAPLAAGIVNTFRARGLKVFGPTKEAAQLESSKDFAKAFMKRHHIPTAAYETFSDPIAAHAWVEKNGAPIVIKADGLAAGKGVVVAMSLEEAHQAIDMMLADNKLGDAGARVVIEEFLAGEEASFIVMVDGKHVLALASSQDHKRLQDGDQGPNTGGMGAYSPAPIVTPQLHARVMREIILPTVAGMEKEGIRYTGFLYAGLMIDAQGNPKTLEFNCRMGDPETQPIMARLKGDFSKVVEHAIAGTLDQVELEWDRRTALGVVLAAYNYPDTPRKGDRISDIPAETENSVTFHAGTQIVDGKLVTSGGRVLCVVGLADSVRSAQNVAYETVNRISFDGMQYRHDIGYRAAGRKQ